MHLKRLTLENFRNYGFLDLLFSDKNEVSFIIGRNAQGKTNILEAVFLLALTKSFRTSHQEDLIKWGEEYAKVTGEFDDQKLEVFLGNPPQPKRTLKKNNVKISTEKFIGNCQIVFFHPEDLNMLYLGPDLRRRYMDILNIQINKNYYRALKSFKRVLEQRNSLLKGINAGIGRESDLDVWDDQLALHGDFLTEERKKTVEFLNAYVQDIYSEIAGKKEEISTQYKCVSQLKKALLRSREADLRAQFTTVGPHRDDIEFTLNKRPLCAHASRGEYRSLLLALKLIELKFYKEKSGQKPLLLLDDVFSELDFERQKMLVQAIKDHQTIITATHLDNIIWNREHKGLNQKIWGFTDGKLQQQAGNTHPVQA
jgi:DNA replication and repair protein RecF